MERIGNVGWFLTDKEMAKLQEAFDTLRLVLPRKNEENTSKLTGDEGNTIPYMPNQGIGINEPCPLCPNCPWKNPADQLWRPWTAPWYYGNPGEPISPDEWKIGDGEWWKHQPYCTSTTDDNLNAVKETLTAENKSEDKEDPWKEFRRHIHQR